MLLRSVFNQNCFTLLYTFAFLWGFRLRKHGFNFEYYLLLNDFPPNLKKKKEYVMDSRFSAASRNTRYFRALEDNEMLEKLQSKPLRRNA